MRGSLQIARVGGIPIRIHWTFLLLPLLVAVAPSGQGWADVGAGLVWILAIFGAVTIHELAHSLVARRRGLRVVDIVLLPIGGVSEIFGIERSWADELCVAIAGPLASFALAGLLAVAGLVGGQTMWPPTLFAGPWVARLMWANVLLGAFNLVPAIPLDGGRVLHAALVRRYGTTEGTMQAANVGRVLAVIMFVGGLFVDLWLAIIGLFVLLAASEERRRAVLRRALTGWKVRELMVVEPVYEAATPIDGRLVAARGERATPVVEAGDYVGIVAPGKLRHADPARTLGQVADREAPLLAEEMDVVPDAFDAFDESGRIALAVARQRRVTGVLYLGVAADAVAHGAQPRGARSALAPPG